jgi:hypothetical protein
MASAIKKTKRAKSPAAKKHVANKVLAELGDDAKAIRIANSAIKKRK